MPHHLVLQRPDIGRCDLSFLPPLPTRPSKNGNGSILRFEVPENFALPPEAAAELDKLKIDHAVLPAIPFSDLGLIVSDMDSTLITIECVDEIAAGVGLKEQVAAITEQSMRGELDFEQSLRKRVGLLAGLPESVLQEVYDQVLKLSPGAEYLLSECKKHGVKFMLVSGGFTYFTNRLQSRLGLDWAFANQLEIVDGKLTGKVLGDVIDAQAKANLLNQYRQAIGATREQVLAIGDGANDIPMLQAAGFGVAYHAKPKTQAAVSIAISHHGWEAVRRLFT